MENSSKSRVLIGCVTHDKDESYVADFLSAIRAQDYTNFDVIFIDTSANDEYAAKLRATGYIVVKGDAELDHPIKRITAGRNIIREQAVSKGYDYVWFVDTDVMPPQNALSRLIRSEKDIAAGLCLMNVNVEGSMKILPNAYTFDEEKKHITPLSLTDAQTDSILSISSAGLGCVLIACKVLKDTRFRYFEDSMAGEDMAFFTDAKEKGFSAVADTSVKCIHLVFPPGDPRNKKFSFDSYEKAN